MILGLLRLLVISFLILTVVYICVVFYSRSVRKAKLREWYEEGDKSQSLDQYIQQGLREYEGSLRRKLIWGVYIVPLLLLILVIYLTNFA